MSRILDTRHSGIGNGEKPLDIGGHPWGKKKGKGDVSDRFDSPSNHNENDIVYVGWFFSIELEYNLRHRERKDNYSAKIRDLELGDIESCIIIYMVGDNRI